MDLTGDLTITAHDSSIIVTQERGVLSHCALLVADAQALFARCPRSCVDLVGLRITGLS